MVRYLLLAMATLAGVALWLALTVYGATEGWGRKPLVKAETATAFFDAAAARIDQSYNGNAAFMVLDDGEIAGRHFVSKGDAVDGDTLFQVASLSKWITAIGVMALVDDGRLDLDAPVSQYLTRWSLPPSDFDNDEVTLRRLLSHTAGLDDGLGYGGFAPGETVQSLEASLTRAADASPGAGGAVRVGAEPGAAWDYSGGGYTLMQLVIEEVSGKTFNDFMRSEVFAPLGMDRSTFVLDEPSHPNVATIYGPEGELATHYKFTALAAASLYTSANDMARFVEAHHAGPNGEPEGRGVVSPELIAGMRAPIAWELGAPIWGMGVMLYAPNNAGDFIAGHDGNNEPAINTAVRFDPASGDGVILLETGNPLLATEIAGEWVFWRTGNVDFMTLTIEFGETLRRAAIGGLVIVMIAIAAGWRKRRRPAA